jgi:hypothetical protein
VKKVSKNGGTITTLVSSEIINTNPGSVKKVSKNGGEVTIISSYGNTNGIALDENCVFWAESIYINAGTIKKTLK